MFFLSAYLNAWGEELWGKGGVGGVWWWGNAILMVVGFGLFAVKKVMSVVQLISASEKIAEIDLRGRREKVEGKE